MTRFEIRTDGDRLTVHTPYHPDFPPRARAMDGKWDGASKAWNFDSRDEHNVRNLCRDIYGTDGTEADLVTIRVTVVGAWNQDTGPLYLAGRQIASARGRDSGAKTGDGVIVLGGGFRSAGSVKNWYTDAIEGTVFEVRDVPRIAVEAIDVPKLTVEILETTIDRAALEEERDRLIARIGEINGILGNGQ